MAYEYLYRITFDNELTKNVELKIYKKDAPLTELQTYEATNIEMNADSEEGTIISWGLIISLWASESNSLTWGTFVANNYDQWKVEMFVNNEIVFSGFLVPEENQSPFLDKPYEVNIRATDGLKLLKNVALKNLIDVDFHGEFTCIEYITACLRKTFQELPLRIYCSIYESSMEDRSVNIAKDWFAQTKFDHRTFQKNAVDFESCYATILKILGRHSRIFYYRGWWNIFYIPEHQYRPGGLYYSEYNTDGIPAGGALVTEGHATVGKNEIIFPYGEQDVQVSSKFAIKSAKTNYPYEVWPEIPLNNRFERGTLIVLLSGTDYRSYTINDWDFGRVNISAGLPFTLTSTTDVAYSKRTFDAYGIETEREIIITTPPNVANQHNWLRSEGVPIKKGDKIELDIDVRHENNFISGSTIGALSAPVKVYIVSGGTYYGLEAEVGKNNGVWRISILTGIVFSYNSITNPTEWHSASIKTDPSPVDGLLYIVFQAAGSVVPSSALPGPAYHFKNFKLTYNPFLSGGAFSVEGDYWEHKQNATMIDVNEEEINISDTIIKVLKGCMLHLDSTPTTPRWHREGLNESRHFKELVNIGVYNLQHRRMYRIEGSFTGLHYSPVNAPLDVQFIGFHKEYQFVDLASPRNFILIPPLQLNIGTGNIQANFQEVLNPAATTSTEETLDALMLRIVAAINATTQAQWTTGGSAPPGGTPFFPPEASIYPYTERSILIQSNVGNTVTGSVNINGGGNSPTITKTYEANLTTTLRWTIFQFGTDIAVPNIFTISIYGFNVNVTVQNVLLQTDGTRTGDTQTYKYIFE